MPIFLQAGTATGIAIQLRDQAVLLYPYYVWNIQSKATKLSYNYQADNYSGSPYFDAFTFSNLAGSPTAGYIPLPGGEYEFNVYEKDTPYDLTIGITNSLVGNGILIIGGTYTSVDMYTQSSSQQIYTYKGY